MRKHTWFSARAVLAACLLFAVAGCSDSGTDPKPREEYGDIVTYAGTGLPGLGDEGLPPEETALYLPQDLTFGPDGVAYILDWNNHRVRAVVGDVMETVIGTGELGDAPAGQALAISLNHPTHISFDLLGRLILSAWHNSKVMRMDLNTGYIEPICGTGARSFGGDNGPANTALLDLPVATAFDPQGRMYIMDQANQRIRRVGTDGVITTFCGNGIPGYAGDNGPAAAAQISMAVGQAAQPSGRMCMDATGNLYFADTGNNRVRRISPDGIITTVAGNGEAKYAGDGGQATLASLKVPNDVAVSPAGELYIADTFNFVIRKVALDGTISTFAGKPGQFGFNGDGAKPTDSLLNRPYGIEFNLAGDLFIADTHNHRVRVIRK